jgi:predicted alpha-1,6-mannanase (GH76 family)
MLDAYERTWNPDYKEKIDRLLRGFIETNHDDWSKNKYNDDSMWACIAFSRAYLDTGISSFEHTAQSNFDMIYARAWDDKLGGGLWWTSENTTKNACVNGPGSIAAYLLYLSTGNPDYLTKATDIYNWERSHLFNPDKGQVYDAMNANGVISTWASTYNQGTFVGAANYLGNVKDARMAADYMMNSMGDAGSGKYRIMPEYGINDGNNGNNSGFNGIGIRWVAKFMRDNNLESSYLGWLQANANAAWNMRRTSDNLSWCQWRHQTPEGANFHSWDCSSSVVALQVVPPDQTGSLDQ